MDLLTLKKGVFSILILGSLISFTACNNQTNSSDSVDPDLVSNNKTAENPDAENPEPIFTCDDPIWEFGKINEGEVVLHTFKIKNTGTEDLVISNCQASCGCTTPTCDKRPIPPGEEGIIEVRFDSKGKPNNQTKNITVTANTVPPANILTIKGFVIPKSE